MTKKYKLKHTNILHNGILRKPNDIIELTEAEAQKLADFVELIPEKTPKTQQNKNSKQKKTETDKSDESQNENQDQNSDENQGENDGE